MLINLSNHPSDKWNQAQLSAALQQFGGVVDIPFPEVAPEGDEVYVDSLAIEYCNRIKRIINDDSGAVHVMGEMTLTASIVQYLTKEGIPCYASTTERCSMSQPDGKTVSVFRFVRFRRYQLN